MSYFPLLWRASRNLTFAVIRDPIWALINILIAPVRGGIWLFKFAIGMAIVSIVMMTICYLISHLVWHDDKAIRNLVFGIGGVLLTIIAGRVITGPLINNFGLMDAGDGANTHGTARFATSREIALLHEPSDGLLIGRDSKTGKLLRYNGPAHLLTMAPTRSGKGVGTLIPNLLTLDRSIICIDPKGENAIITARARTRFGRVHILDPFGITGAPTASFNPLERLDISSVDIAEDAATLADALVYDETGVASEAHWNEEAKALIGGLILHIAASEPKDRRNLSTLREYLTLAPDDFLSLLEAMQGSNACNKLIKRAANRHMSKSDREAAGVLSSAQRHTHFLDSPRMAGILAKSDFDFGDLKRETATVFLVLPPDRLGTYARWLRLMVTQSLSDMARTANRARPPVLYLLDEFAALGHLAPVERAMGLMAGYGVQLWPILQDVHQLRATYGKRAGTFLSNAGVLQVFGVNDHESARLVSDLAGQGTVVLQAQGKSMDSEKSGLSYSEQHIARPLLTPDEVRNVPQHIELLFITGARPIAATKLRYFADKEFKGLY